MIFHPWLCPNCAVHGGIVVGGRQCVVLSTVEICVYCISRVAPSAKVLVFWQIAQEEALRKAAEEAELEAAVAAAAEKEKAAKTDKKPGGKKGKSRSPSPKKGKGDKKAPAAAPVAPTPPPSL